MPTRDKIKALLANEKYGDAYEILEKEINRNPKQLWAILELGHLSLRAERYGMAYTFYQRALQMGDRTPELRNNLGCSALNLTAVSGDESFIVEGENHVRECLKLKQHPGSYSALALAQIYQCNPVEALKLADKAMALGQPSKDLRETIAYANFMTGNYGAGFDAYEAILNKGPRRLVPFNNEPRWDMEAVGGNLFVLGEQGLGDEISYASFVPDAAKDNRVTLECDPRLAGLFARSMPEVTVRGTLRQNREWEGEFDYCTLSGSLGRRYRKTRADFPRTPFLVPDPERCVQWRALLDTLPGRPVGIAWTGGTSKNFRARRNLDLDTLLPILKTPGISWVSLQYAPDEEEIAQFMGKHGIEIKRYPRAAGKGVDYDETAALVASLDCVVSVCTSIVHLCGAIGKKCLVLTPEKPRWWYGLQGLDHDWYESIETWRQVRGKWPLAEVAQRLEEYLFKLESPAKAFKCA